MVKYQNKVCEVCLNEFAPTAPNQKYCSGCKEVGRRLTARVYDRRTTRIKKGYKEHIRKCLSCGEEFKTYYTKKVYCGSPECAKERIRIKNFNFNARRDKALDAERCRDYYRRNKHECRLRKAIKYRKDNLCTTEYTPRGFLRHTVEYVSNYVEEFGYKLLSDEYVNNRTKVKLLCPNGHEWETTFHNFKDVGNRCLYCYLANNYTSKPEQSVLDYCIEHCSDIEIIHNDRSQIPPFEIDIYFPDKKLGVEVCGLYWHSELSGGKSNDYHYNKMSMCRDVGVNLITIFDDELRDNFDVVVAKIKSVLGVYTNKISADSCELKEISVKDANKFFDANNIHGGISSKKAWGLFYNNQLVSACSIGNYSRHSIDGTSTVELHRFCSLIDTEVVGGFDRLFNSVKLYCNKRGFNIIKTYCDMRYDGDFVSIYEDIGFVCDGTVEYLPHYIVNDSRCVDTTLSISPEELFILGYDRIWDCGYKTYIYKVGV